VKILPVPKEEFYADLGVIIAKIADAFVDVQV
jgi:hypothetical protein